MAQFSAEQWQERMLRVAAKQGAEGCPLSELLTGRSGTSSRARQQEALAFLEDHAFLFRVGPTRTPRGARYVHREVVEKFASRISAARAGSTLPHDLSPAKVRLAYEQLVARSGGIVDVLVADLAQASSAPADYIRALLKEMHREGAAQLSRGEWSLATPEQRQYAVTMDGTPFLWVRFVGAQR